jgi:hypothetical protein
MSDLIGGDRPVRGCDVCGQVDDHPKHGCLVPPDFEGATLSQEVLQKLLDNGVSAASLQELQDPRTVIRHIDCCAQRGCPTGICIQSVKEWNGKTGKGMLAHLEKVTY